MAHRDYMQYQRSEHSLLLLNQTYPLTGRFNTATKPEAMDFIVGQHNYLPDEIDIESKRAHR